MGKFTYLDLDTLDDPKGLFNSFQLEKLSGELKNIEDKKEIELIGFEPLINKYLNNSSDKNIEENNFQKETIDKNVHIEKSNIPVENPNTINLTNKDDINKDKIRVSEDEKRINIIINNNGNCSNNLDEEIINNKNIDDLKGKTDKIKTIENKNLSRTNSKEIYIKKTVQITPKKMIVKNIGNNSQNSLNGKTINKIEMEHQDEIKFKSNEKINEGSDIIITGKTDSLNNKNINFLRINLLPQKVNEYIDSQKMKYFNIFNNNFLMKYVIDNLPIQNLPFKFKSNEIKYWNLKKALKEITDLFSNNDNIMKPEYGYFISDKQILFYATDDSKQENEILFNSKYLKQINYDYATEKESSYKTYTVNSENGNDKIDYFLIKGIDFEKNWTFFFDSYFNLQKLPNIFFPISTIFDSKYQKKIKKKNKAEDKSKSIDESNKKEDKITFEKYVDSIFNSFIETDLARINKNNIDIQPEFIFKPFINEPPIHVYRDKYGKFICEVNKSNELKIHASSIILGEVKNSVPEKVLNIKKDEEIDVKNIQRSLYFVLYKLIKKIDYYLNFVKYEILDNSEKIKNYKFQLFLVYNNKPISKMNTFIKSCLENLISNGYINNEFIFQIIYSSPSVSSLNINNLSKEIKAINSKIFILEDNIGKKDKQIQNLQSEMDILKKKIKSLESERKLEKGENPKNSQKQDEIKECEKIENSK